MPQYSSLLDAFQRCPVKKSPPYSILPYLKMIAKLTKNRIHEIYREDFVAFGYSFLEDLE